MAESLGRAVGQVTVRHGRELCKKSEEERQKSESLGESFGFAQALTGQVLQANRVLQAWKILEDLETGLETCCLKLEELGRSSEILVNAGTESWDVIGQLMSCTR